MDRPRLDLDAVEQALARARPAPSSDYDLEPDLHTRLSPARRLKQAAVLVPIVERGPGLSVLFTRRAASLRTHAGQVAFPGGRMDAADRDLAAAALREANEEIGLAPAQVRTLGTLGSHETVTGFTVTPVIGRVVGRFLPVPDPAEVAEVFEVPLAFLMDEANFQIHRRRWQGGWRRYYAIPYGPHYIWGATARMVKALAARLAP